MKATVSLLSAVLIAMWAVEASAETVSPSSEEVGVSEELGPGAYEHDGFYLRFSWGLGALTGNFDDDWNDSGLVHNSELAIGLAVASDLIVHAVFYDVQASRSVAPYDEVLNLDAAGLGATYYLMPSNVFFTGAASILVAHEIDGQDTFAFAGPSVMLGVGKEWWVSENWGLGLRAQASWSHLSSAASLGGASDIVGAGIAVGATYN